MSTRVVNKTRMTVHADVLEDRAGRPALTVIAKMAWAVDAGGVVTLPEARAEVRHDDVWTGAPFASSVRYPSDIVPEKPGTDVLLVGTAHPPSDRAVTSIDVHLRITGARLKLQRSARVHGPRVWYPGLTGVAPGAAGRLGPTPLTWELAYGGVDESDPDRPLIEDANPVGSGVARARNTLVGRPAPVIEDPEAPIGSASPRPAGFGPIPPQWAPRLRFAGTMDEAWRRERAPLPPLDRDARFYACAPPGLWSSEPLAGDELCEIVGVTPGGLWRFRLPRYAPVITCVVRGEERACAAHLDTYLVDADEGRVEITHRASIAIPRKAQAIERVTIDAAPLPDDIEASAADEDEDEEPA